MQKFKSGLWQPLCQIKLHHIVILLQHEFSICVQTHNTQSNTKKQKYLKSICRIVLRGGVEMSEEELVFGVCNEVKYDNRAKSQEY